MKNYTKFIILVLISVVLVSAYLLFVKPQSFEIKIPCQLNFLNETCSIEESPTVSYLIYMGYNITSEELNEKWLNEWCKELKENIWSCEKYLVLKK